MPVSRYGCSYRRQIPHRQKYEDETSQEGRLVRNARTWLESRLPKTYTWARIFGSFSKRKGPFLEQRHIEDYQRRKFIYQSLHFPSHNANWRSTDFQSLVHNPLYLRNFFQHLFHASLPNHRPQQHLIRLYLAKQRRQREFISISTLLPKLRHH
jgi:hypothetical protein